MAKGIQSATVVSAGGGHTCAVLSDAMVNCWGEGDFGKLGNATTTESLIPVIPKGMPSAKSISAGADHTCAVHLDGKVSCWGLNDFGQIGNGKATTTTDSFVPTTVSGIEPATSVSSGESHTCVLLTSGRVACWGSNSDGQLGSGKIDVNENPLDSLFPVDVAGIATSTAVSAGTNHTCALLVSGTIMCWGSNTEGQLGSGKVDRDGDPVDSPYPINVFDIKTATAVSAGGTHTCALLTSGQVKCWGDNTYGQLGDGTPFNSSTPVTVIGF